MKPTLPIYRAPRGLLLLFLVWIVASALYYIDNLFSPNFYMGYDEGVVHKAVKYAVCGFFTLAFCAVSRAYSLLLLITMVVAFTVLLVLYRGTLEISTLSILITATMIAYALVPSIWEADLQRIGRITVYSGAVVGFFSIIEMTVLAPLFETFWASTGSIRSISTMFNPNNLGLYTGACLLLLPYLGLRPIVLFASGALIFYAFAASGSRTAWIAIIVVVGWQILTSTGFRRTVRRLLRRYSFFLLFSGLGLAAIITANQAYHSQSTEIEIVNRGTDLYTLGIRADNFISFLKSIDLGILFPDLTGERANLIQDNFYLVFINSFGLIGVIFFFAFFAAHFTLRRSPNPDMLPWKLIFAFYMVSGLSGSQLNSFPNNQLFFLSIGAIYVLDMRFLRKISVEHRSSPQAI